MSDRTTMNNINRYWMNRERENQNKRQSTKTQSLSDMGLVPHRDFDPVDGKIYSVYKRLPAPPGMKHRK